MRMPDGRANPSHPHFSGLVSSCESPLRPFGSCWHSGGGLRRLQRREAGWWKQCPEVRLPVGRPGEGLGAGSRCRPWLNPSTLPLGQEHWRREAGQPRCQARKAIPPEQRPGGLPLPLPELGVSCLTLPRGLSGLSRVNDVEEGGRGDGLPAAEVWAPCPTLNPGHPPLSPVGWGGIVLMRTHRTRHRTTACSSLKWSHWRGGQVLGMQVHRRVMFKVHTEHEIYTLNSGPQISIIGLTAHLHRATGCKLPQASQLAQHYRGLYPARKRACVWCLKQEGKAPWGLSSEVPPVLTDGQESLLKLAPPSSQWGSQDSELSQISGWITSS